MLLVLSGVLYDCDPQSTDLEHEEPVAAGRVADVAHNLDTVLAGDVECRIGV